MKANLIIQSSIIALTTATAVSIEAESSTRKALRGRVNRQLMPNMPKKSRHNSRSKKKKNDSDAEVVTVTQATDSPAVTDPPVVTEPPAVTSPSPTDVCTDTITHGSQCYNVGTHCDINEQTCCDGTTFFMDSCDCVEGMVWDPEIQTEVLATKWMCATVDPLESCVLVSPPQECP